MMPPSIQDIRAMFRLFGFDLDYFMMNNPVNSYEQATAVTEKIRKEIKVRFHRLALSMHPDKGGDAEKFKELNQAYNFIQKEVNITPPEPVQQVIFQFYTGTTSTYAAY